METMKEEINTVKIGKPWDILGYFDSYEDASNARAELVARWETDSKEGMESKIKLRRQPERFVIKTRLHPDFEQKSNKKSKKKSSLKKNKGTT
tara:strand:+ start:692 stop:970 length:279 start_codon:yes stop_codon:yes gene_type:complete